MLGHSGLPAPMSTTSARASSSSPSFLTIIHQTGNSNFH